MNKGYYGNWAKIDKYKYEVKEKEKKEKDLKLESKTVREKRKKRKEGKIRGKWRDLEEISKKGKI